MKLSVIIVNFNHKYFPRLAVEALEKSKVNFPYEIIVVDNASHDEESMGFLEQAHQEKRIVLIKSPVNLGFGRGNNLGVEYAKGRYVFFHNPDVTVQEDSLQKMVDYFEQHHDIGILGPKLMYSSGKIQESCRRNMKWTDLVFKRTFLGKLPFFRKRVKKYLMEDFDLCRMVKKTGFRVVYYPDAVMMHYHKRLSGGSFFKMLTKKVFWLHVASAWKYFWKWKHG